MHELFLHKIFILFAGSRHSSVRFSIQVVAILKLRSYSTSIKYPVWYLSLKWNKYKTSKASYHKQQIFQIYYFWKQNIHYRRIPIYAQIYYRRYRVMRNHATISLCYRYKWKNSENYFRLYWCFVWLAHIISFCGRPSIRFIYISHISRK